MSKYRLAPSAEEDMLEIYDYSQRTWGDAQARKYVADLYSLFPRLLNPPTGRKLDHHWVGLRSKKRGKHVVYYLDVDGEAYILNILHGRMDPHKHLDLPE